MAHPVFKTGRAEQPSAWKVRFLRRSVPLEAGLDVEGGSVPYIASWAVDGDDVIERDAAEIDRITALLERALEVLAGFGRVPAGRGVVHGRARPTTAFRARSGRFFCPTRLPDDRLVAGPGSDRGM